MTKTCYQCKNQFDAFPIFWLGRTFCQETCYEVWRAENPNAKPVSYFTNQIGTRGFAGKWKEIKEATNFNEAEITNPGAWDPATGTYN